MQINCCSTTAELSCTSVCYQCCRTATWHVNAIDHMCILEDLLVQFVLYMLHVALQPCGRSHPVVIQEYTAACQQVCSALRSAAESSVNYLLAEWLQICLNTT